MVINLLYQYFLRFWWVQVKRHSLFSYKICLIFCNSKQLQTTNISVFETKTMGCLSTNCNCFMFLYCLLSAKLYCFNSFLTSTALSVISFTK